MKASSDNDNVQISVSPHVLLKYIESPQHGDKNLLYLGFNPLSHSFLFVNSIFFLKSNFFILMFNDSLFSYKVAAEYKLPTSLGA